ncbi:MAG TPA: MEDS domain-containing protein [Terriglobales bacterium]|nr:MEDS domain-containing protein [Terriglobales bacterium]
MAIELITCDEVLAEVSNYVDGTVATSLRQRMDHHFESCPQCKSVLDGIRNVVELAGDERALPAPRNMSRNLRAKLDQFVHDQEAGESGRAQEIALGITADNVALGSHLIYFWDSDEDFERCVHFLYPGLGSREHCIVFGHDEAIEKVKMVLRARGFDPDALIQNLQLTVLRRQSSAAGTVSDIADTVQAAVRAGATAVRFLGNLGMGRAALPAGEDDVVDLECKVSGVIQGLPCVIVCMYDVSTLSGRLILNGGLKTHRLAVGSDGVRENPYYQPGPDFEPDTSTIH